MPSLPSLLANHGSLLIIDAASTCVQIGLLRSEKPAIWRTSTEEAGTGLFDQTSKILLEGNLPLEQVGAFIYCEGPGSMLGIRTVAMALRTWQTLRPHPAYAYQSLAIAAYQARGQHPGIEFAMIADARRESWHYQHVSVDGTMDPLQRLQSDEIPEALLLETPENFRVWSKPPRPLVPASYDLAKIMPSLANEDYFRLVAAPDAFQHTAPEYKKWSAQVHQAPVSPPSA